VLFEDEIDTDAQRKKLIQTEREKYLRNEGKSYSWDAVKKWQSIKQKGMPYKIEVRSLAAIEIIEALV